MTPMVSRRHFIQAFAATAPLVAGCTITLPDARPRARTHRPSPSVLGPLDVPERAFEAARQPGSTVARAVSVSEVLKTWEPTMYPQSFRYVPMPPAAFGESPWPLAARQAAERGSFERTTTMRPSPPQVLFLMGIEAYAKALEEADPDRQELHLASAKGRWARSHAAARACEPDCMAALRAAARLATHFADKQESTSSSGAIAQWCTDLDARLEDAVSVAALDEAEAVKLGGMGRLWVGATQNRPVPERGRAPERDRQFCAALRLAELKAAPESALSKPGLDELLAVLSPSW